MNTPRRIVQFSTGNVGVHSLRALIDRPDVDLVGVHATSPDKVGRDAAELCGLTEPTGVTATNDVAALVALRPDCVVYTSQAETRPDEALRDVTAFLEAGVDVVASSFVWLVHPPHADAWLTEPIEQACHRGGATMYVNGIDPGFSGDVLAFAALRLSTRVDRVVVQEICDYGTYDDAEFTGVQFGFGSTAQDPDPLICLPGVTTAAWGGSVRLIADELGLEIEEYRERHERWFTSAPIDCTMMRVEAGGQAALRFAVEGIVGGEPVIVLEHVNRLSADAAPDWPAPPDGRPGVHRVVVTGRPGVEIDTFTGLGVIDHNIGGVMASAALLINAIDAVAAAPPGLVSATELPIAQARGLHFPERSPH